MKPEALCTAHSKRTGQPCQRAAMRGRSLCYMHGGKNLRGLAAPGWKDGRYSKALPTDSLAAYERARTDPELIALRDELALLDTRLVGLVGTLPAGGAGPLWTTMQRAWRTMQAARAQHDYGKMHEAAAEIEAALADGAAVAATWAELYEAIALRGKMADLERKRLEAMQATVTVDRVMALVTALGMSVKKHVHDRATLVAITDDLAALLRGNPEVARAAG